MARALLISLNVTREPYPVYPLGVQLVADAARAAGHETRLWDVAAAGGDAATLDELAATFRPDVVGVSLRNIDNTDAVSERVYADVYGDQVRALRRRFDAPVVLGGTAFSLFPQALLERTGADAGVVGEGEAAFRALLDEFDRTGRVEPGARRAKEAMPPEDFGSTRREPALTAFYLREGGMLNVQTKRGCPKRCAYCPYPLLEGRRWRFRPVEAVVDEIQALRRDHGADYLCFTDSVFNDESGRHLEIAEAMIRRGIETPWMAFMSPDAVDGEAAALLRRSGLRAVEWGTDATTDTTLAAMGKSFGWADVERANRLFAEAGVACAHYVIFGGPEETEATVAEGLGNVARLERCVVTPFTGVRVLPGTPMHERARAEGVVAPEDTLLDPVYYVSPETPLDGLEAALREAFADRLDRVYPSDRYLERIPALRALGRRGPLWDLLIEPVDGQTRRRRRRA